MRKNIFVIIVSLSMLCLLMSSCANPKQNDSSEGLSDFIKTTSQEEIHKVLGAPSGALSGFYGDVYVLDNGTRIVFYYEGENGKVENMKIIDKDDTATFTIK